MQGEAVASGSLHVDNIAPSLFGGLVLTVGIDHPRVKQIPVPHGDARGDRASAHVPVDEAGARASSSAPSTMSDFVWQTANLAGFISGCYTNDLDMIRASLRGRGHRAAAPGADPGLRRGARARDGGGRARLLDLRRRSDDVRLGARSRCAPRCATRWWRSSRAARHRSRRLDRATSSRRGARVLRVIRSEP